MSINKVTVLGAGTMGVGVVHSLLRAGLDVTVWNRTPERAEDLVKDGARAATSVSSAVADADAVISVLFDTDAVLKVLDEAGPSVQPAAIWVQSSTVGVDGTDEVLRRATALGLQLVEAMLLGTKQPAEEGKLVLLTAGDANLLDTVKPVFDAISQKQVRVGPTVGQGTALKLACNAWIASITAATAQSIALAQAQGLDPQLFLDAIEGTGPDSKYAHLKGKNMMEGDYAPQFGVDGLRKDLDLIEAVADREGVDTTLLRALAGLYSAASDAGHAKDDIGSVYTVLTGSPGSTDG